MSRNPQGEPRTEAVTPLTDDELDQLRRDHRTGGPHPGSNLTVCIREDGPHIGRCDVRRLLAMYEAAALRAIESPAHPETAE